MRLDHLLSKEKEVGGVNPSNIKILRSILTEQETGRLRNSGTTGSEKSWITDSGKDSEYCLDFNSHCFVLRDQILKMHLENCTMQSNKKSEVVGKG